MELKDVVVGEFVVANHTLGSDHPLDAEVFGTDVLQVGTAYRVLAVQEEYKGDTQPILVELPKGGVGADPSGWWCHPKYFTAQENTNESI